MYFAYGTFYIPGQKKVGHLNVQHKYHVFETNKVLLAFFIYIKYVSIYCMDIRILVQIFMYIYAFARNVPLSSMMWLGICFHQKIKTKCFLRDPDHF